MKRIILLSIFLLTLILSGCTYSISEVTLNDDYVDENVRISGVVKTPIQIGPLSGFTLEDDNGDSILVASSDVPSEGEKTTVSGTLRKGILGMNFYIEVQ